MLDLNIDAQAVIDTIRGIKSPCLKEYVLFDLYLGAGIPDGKKSLAIRFRYGSDQRTLTDEEVNQAHQKIVDSLCKRLGAEIR
jgi:phenylalanyl-tRNA synthetase beta chain